VRAGKNLADYPKLAVAIKEHWRDDPVHCTRLVRQTAAHSALLQSEDDLADFHRKPESTGSAEWDALIAGVAAHTWSLSGHAESLPWTRFDQPLSEWWEPGDGPKRWRDWNLIHTPPSLRDRRVIFPEQWLRAV
jgi:hypothetical protein